MLFHRLIFFYNQRSMPLFIEHLVEGMSRFFLRLEVSLPGFTIFQKDLRHPLFAFAIQALKDGAGAMCTSPTLALLELLRLFLFLMLLFSSHDTSSTVSSAPGQGSAPSKADRIHQPFAFCTMPFPRISCSLKHLRILRSNF